MNKDLLKESLFSGVWGTCGPREEEASKKLAASYGDGNYALLTYSASAARQILSLYERMTGLDVPEGSVRLIDFGFAGALVTADPELYQTFYAIHHCGHRPGIGATVDLSEETILGGDMRVTEWQALEILEVLGE